jgi:hypothetical protein
VRPLSKARALLPAGALAGCAQVPLPDGADLIERRFSLRPDSSR